jgi:hypothetical protein
MDELKCESPKLKAVVLVSYKLYQLTKKWHKTKEFVYLNSFFHEYKINVLLKRAREMMITKCILWVYKQFT